MLATQDKQNAFLLLDDGMLFEGTAIGKIGTTTGEICFNTGMTGYQEIFTDPSYFGQILVNTNAHIGNYGTLPQEDESASVKIEGLVVKNFSEAYSRKLADTDLQDYLERNNIVGISDIDTRALVRHIRDKGAMNAIISSEITDANTLKDQLKAVPQMEGLELASKVCTNEPYEYGDTGAALRVAVLDLGVKNSILNNLAQRGCFLKVFPARTSIAEIKEWKPDGFFLSNGPGDPGTMDYALETASYFIENNYPVFGICLGHQIIARSLGIQTYKMHHGHRGANHPVINKLTGRSEITTQNHGFGVDPESLKNQQNGIEITHVNLNDDTIEGIKIKNKDVFSVQYHPEASPGPHDSRYLFDQFIDNIKKHKS
jgi:carbamoyl-phosphate synthase small subunit